MADGVNFGGLTEELGVCECPRCKETIDANASVCRFCGAKIDHAAAEEASHLLARIDQACNDASILRNAAVAAFLLSLGAAYALLRSGGRLFIAFGLQNVILAFSGLVVMVSWPFPIWSMRWWRKYANLASDDEDFQSARVTVRSTGFTAAGAFAAFSLVIFLVVITRILHR